MIELVPARATTVLQRIRGFFKNDMRYINSRFTNLLTYLHCPLSCMQACISSSCSPVSLIRVSMKVLVGRPLPQLQTTQLPRFGVLARVTLR